MGGRLAVGILGWPRGRPCAAVFWPISAPLTATIAHPAVLPGRTARPWIFQSREGGCRTPDSGFVTPTSELACLAYGPAMPPRTFLRRRFPPTNAETVSSPAPSREGMRRRIWAAAGGGDDAARKSCRHGEGSVDRPRFDGSRSHMPGSWSIRPSNVSLFGLKRRFFVPALQLSLATRAAAVNTGPQGHRAAAWC
jgi:hypothetical protein